MSEVELSSPGVLRDVSKGLFALQSLKPQAKKTPWRLLGVRSEKFTPDDKFKIWGALVHAETAK